MKRKIWLLIATVCALAVLSFSVSAREPEQTTALGLYAQWQSEGQPGEVIEVFFDRETNRLVVILEAGSHQAAEQLQSSVTDPENLEIRFRDPPVEDTPQQAAAKRRKGALVLLAAYGGMMATVGVLFLCARKRKNASNEEKAGQNPFTRL